MRRALRTAAVGLTVGTAALAAGCGLRDPYDRPAASERRGASAAASGDPHRPDGVVRQVALAWSNWTTGTVAAQHRRAIALTADAAARRLSVDGRQVERSVAALPRPVRSRGTVEAVALRGTGGWRTAIVVTRETLTGLGPLGSDGEYHVTLATVERRGSAWVVSRWSRQP
jgi:hypothetical protein